MSKCTVCERRMSSARSKPCGSCRVKVLNTPPGAWVEDAACRDRDPDLWWPEGNDMARRYEAQEICLGCPVAEQCLQYALDTRQVFGIWGGLTPHGRLMYAKRMKAVG